MPARIKSRQSVRYYFLMIWIPLIIVALLAIVLLIRSNVEARTVTAHAEQRAQVQEALTLLEDSIRDIRSDALYLATLSSLTPTPAHPEPLLEDSTYALTSFMQFNPQYEQLRVLDLRGIEQVRVERQDNEAVIKPPEQLQNKAARYYVQLGLQLEPGQLYFSAFDLNVERGEIQRPLNPTIRVATPVADKTGETAGLLVMNYRGANLLDALAAMDSPRTGQLWLVNQNGYWLKGPTADQEWGFMLPERSEQSLAKKYVRLWSQIIQNTQLGELLDADDHYSFASIDLTPTESPSFEQTLGRLHVVSHLSGGQLDQLTGPLKKGLWQAGVLIALLSAGLAYVLARSVAQRWHTESSLQDSEAKFRAMIEAAPDAIIITDTDGTIVLLNEQAIRLFEYTQQELLGQKVEVLLPEELRRGHIQHRQGYVSAPRPRLMGSGLRLQAKRKDGSELPVEVSLSPIRTPSETLVFCAIRDVTERRETEDKIKQLNNGLTAQNNELQVVNRELEAFSYSVSHDLRAPLRAIDGFSQILTSSLSDKLDEQEVDYFNRIRKAAQKMSKLIDDLLLLARVSRADVLSAEVNLSNLAESAVQNLKELQPEREIDIQIQKGICVEGDLALLQVTVQNLIGNAWKFTGKTEHPQIQVGTEIQDEEEVIFVRDNGAGFDMNYADKLFIPFQRLHSGNDFPGSGVGLATIERIMAKLNGRIWAESVTGQGATFFLKLKLVTNRS
ncbi:MAG: PAS domain S-box protein [Halopseudomonas sp.]|uniref:sensor histidine kinase n=1 Tax=Halopseudomonas sp. TaxID=2901191 RepID=UPI0030020BFD